LTISSHSFHTFVTSKKSVRRRSTFCVLLLTLPGEPTSTRCYIFIDRLFVLSSTIAVLSMVLARESYLRILRQASGAFRTSPASSMCVQANEPPLYIRRRMLSIQYSLRRGSSPSNPAYNTVFSPKFKASLKKYGIVVIITSFTLLIRQWVFTQSKRCRHYQPATDWSHACYTRTSS